MNIKPLRTKKDYRKALKRVEELWGSKKNTPEGDEFDILCTLVEAYEDKHFPIAPPDPIEAVRLRLEQLNLAPSDLARYLGGRRRVNAFLSGKRPLTIDAARILHKRFGVPAESLLS